jgi:hypothetical protein
MKASSEPEERESKMFETEFEFVLPLGYADEDGTLHRDGVMRRATERTRSSPYAILGWRRTHRT